MHSKGRSQAISSAEYIKDWRAKNREQDNANARRRYAVSGRRWPDNRDPEKARERARRWDKANPGKRRETSRRNNWKKAGIDMTTERYDEMLARQDGRCALCGRHQTEFKRRLAVDHNHKTGVVRGLLCYPCNISLGKLGDDTESILRVLDYLDGA
jgi:hypothetical protein